MGHSKVLIQNCFFVYGSFKGCPTVGDSEKSPCNELWQTQSFITLLLWKRNHAEGRRFFTYILSTLFSVLLCILVNWTIYIRYIYFLFVPWLQVAGERYVYKFVCDPEALFSMAFPDNQRPVLKTDVERQINEEDTVPLSHFDESMAYIQEGTYCSSRPHNEGYVYWCLPSTTKVHFQFFCSAMMTETIWETKRAFFAANPQNPPPSLSLSLSMSALGGCSLVPFFSDYQDSASTLENSDCECVTRP